MVDRSEREDQQLKNFCHRIAQQGLTQVLMSEERSLRRSAATTPSPTYEHVVRSY